MRELGKEGGQRANLMDKEKTRDRKNDLPVLVLAFWAQARMLWGFRVTTLPFLLLCENEMS